MNATKIEYLNFTWSPLVGCSGKDCAVYAYCFAKKFKKRNLLKCPECYAFKPHRHFERLEQPLTTKKPQRIGVCFSADFWDEGFSMDDRMPIFNIVAQAPQHWFISLTKHPPIPNYVYPKNWVQGVTINKQSEIWRLDTLLGMDVKTKFVSFEPLYEDLGDINLEGLDWIIIGAQTHPTFRPKNLWIKNLVDRAGALGIPTFIKNNITGWNFKEYPEKFSIGVK